MTNSNIIKGLCKDDNCNDCGKFKKRIFKNKNCKIKNSKNIIIISEDIMNELDKHFCSTIFSELSVETDEKDKTDE
tara:strand:- start:481 stop:708 length:228 start_codon:yes stop_codon:yes gene_type:complete